MTKTIVIRDVSDRDIIYREHSDQIKDLKRDFMKKGRFDQSGTY